MPLPVLLLVFFWKIGKLKNDFGWSAEFHQSYQIATDIIIITTIRIEFAQEAVLFQTLTLMPLPLIFERIRKHFDMDSARF